MGLLLLSHYYIVKCEQKKYFLKKKDHDSQVTAAAQNFVRKKLMLKGAIQAFLTLFDLNN